MYLSEQEYINLVDNLTKERLKNKKLMERNEQLKGTLLLEMEEIALKGPRGGREQEGVGEGGGVWRGFEAGLGGRGGDGVGELRVEDLEGMGPEEQKKYLEMELLNLRREIEELKDEEFEEIEAKQKTTMKNKSKKPKVEKELFENCKLLYSLFNQQENSPTSKQIMEWVHKNNLLFSLKKILNENNSNPLKVLKEAKIHMLLKKIMKNKENEMSIAPTSDRKFNRIQKTNPSKREFSFPKQNALDNQTSELEILRPKEKIESKAQKEENCKRKTLSKKPEKQSKKLLLNAQKLLKNLELLKNSENSLKLTSKKLVNKNKNKIKDNFSDTKTMESFNKNKNVVTSFSKKNMENCNDNFMEKSEKSMRSVKSLEFLNNKYYHGDEYERREHEELNSYV